MDRLVWTYESRLLGIQLYRKGVQEWGVRYHPRTQWVGCHVYIDLGRVEIRIGG